MVTLVIHADAAGVEADVVLVFITFVLSDAEQNGVLHLHPELSVFVLQYRLILLLQEENQPPLNTRLTGFLQVQSNTF